MKKHYFRSAVAALLPLLLIAQPVEACTGFIIGKKLTADGSTLVGRTEDLEPNHNKNFVVRERVYNKKGFQNLFTFLLHIAPIVWETVEGCR